uniref:Type I polyketide synthase n=1 Tax=Gambierdiscus excentricus TaxID=986170 RepID=A0A1S6K850_9DINO|nr:type I polyketide synthase [Gambierdiscus excentricus]
MAQRVMPPRAGTKADVVLGQIPPESVGLEIVHKLAAKGFCVVAPNFALDTLVTALDEVKGFDKLQRWSKVNGIIQDGLLGAEGSCKIAELESPDLDDEVRSDGEMLMKVDYTITHLGFRMEPYLDLLGFDVTHRSLAVVHQTGEPDEDEESVALDEKTVMKWLACFLRHKVMVIVFLGPTSGTLELQPYSTEDTELHEVLTAPGMIVILRPDLMSHKHFSPGMSVALSSFFLTGGLSKRATEGWTMIPPARELDEWTMGRLKVLKEQSQEDAVWSPDIPRDWQHAMNHIYHKGQMVAVRGTAIKSSMCDDMDTFWQVSTNGPDYVVDIPLLRWDHDEMYDPDLESWRYYKTYCKHASFMEGIELFDCKMFNMSPNEARSMDPHQRFILEIGYMSLHNMGLRKNTLVNSACGVYVGCGNVEWSMLPKEDSGAFGATGGALSINSGRFSFTLGLKGPSMTLDTESSSGATATYLAAESIMKKGRAAANDLAVAIGSNIVLSAVNWPTLCATNSLSPEGRCMTFNVSASGYVRGDGTAAAALKCLTEWIDGDFVTHDDDQLLGAIAGTTMNNNGKSASLTAPSGPAEQEAISDAIRNASISIFDIDSVEAFGSGAFLADAIEVSSLLRAHRTEDMKEPLALTAVKSSVGNQVETSGITGFLKTIFSAQWNVMTPNLHLMQANPHMETADQSPFTTECLEYKMRSTFAGTMSRGNGGSNVYLLSWGQINPEKVPAPPPTSTRELLTFWPGGGGQLESDKCPNREYTIVGSWGQWPEPIPMEPEGDGIYGFTVTLGENRWEWFVIWLDSDPRRVLHPGYGYASKDFPVLGPAEDAEGACWMINGRPESVYVPCNQTDIIGEGVEVFEDEYGQKVASHRVDTADMGYPGDQYRVHLRIAGKWRTVTWEKVKRDEEASPPVLLRGKYYVAGDWSQWELTEMQADPDIPGVFFQDVKVPAARNEFQIVRNKDWSQIIYPDVKRCAGDGSFRVLGPDDLGVNHTWLICCQPGTPLRIEFQRTVSADTDVMKVSWRNVSSNMPGSAAAQLVGRATDKQAGQQATELLEPADAKTLRG